MTLPIIGALLGIWCYSLARQKPNDDSEVMGVLLFGLLASICLFFGLMTILQ